MDAGEWLTLGKCEALGMKLQGNVYGGTAYATAWCNWSHRPGDAWYRRRLVVMADTIRIEEERDEDGEEFDVEEECVLAPPRMSVGRFLDLCSILAVPITD